MTLTKVLVGLYSASNFLPELASLGASGLSIANLERACNVQNLVCVWLVIPNQFFKNFVTLQLSSPLDQTTLVMMPRPNTLLM